MTRTQTRRTTTPTGDAGWLGRVVAALGILLVVAAGIALSPGATSAGQDWSAASRPMSTDHAPATVTDLDRESIEHRPVASPARSGTPIALEPIEAASRRHLVARLLDRVRSGLERWSGVMVTSAAR